MAKRMKKRQSQWKRRAEKRSRASAVGRAAVCFTKLGVEPYDQLCSRFRMDLLCLIPNRPSCAFLLPGCFRFLIIDGFRVFLRTSRPLSLIFSIRSCSLSSKRPFGVVLLDEPGHSRPFSAPGRHLFFHKVTPDYSDLSRSLLIMSKLGFIYSLRRRPWSENERAPPITRPGILLLYPFLQNREKCHIIRLVFPCQQW